MEFELVELELERFVFEPVLRFVLQQQLVRLEQQQQWRRQQRRRRLERVVVNAAEPERFVWVFVGEGAKFPGGLFTGFRSMG